jgi:hypothetical protein
MTQDIPEYRLELQRKFNAFYNGYLYFGFTNVAAVAAIVAAVYFVDGVRPLEWLTIPLAFLFANFIEWFSHRGPMHNRRAPMDILFDRHTLLHHMYFPHENMSVQSHREWGYVLFPAWGVLMIFLTAALPSLLLGYLFSQNVALLFFIVAVSYYILYEWLHLTYHLPEDHPILRNRLVLALRRHHVYHHHKRLMQKYNFNVTIPIFDVLFRTQWREEEQPTPADIPEEGVSSHQ